MPATEPTSPDSASSDALTPQAAIDVDDELSKQSSNDKTAHVTTVLRHRRATRWMHWINFPILAIMIWSGLRIYWADLQDPQVLAIAGIELFRFFPDWFNDFFGLRAKLATGLGYHLVFAWLFMINGLAHVTYTVRSGHWRDLNPGRHGLRKALIEIKDSFSPKHKTDTSKGYNPAQRVIYNLIVALGGVSVLTGFAIYRPNTLSPLVAVLGGYQTAKTIHFVVTIIFMGFFFVHVAQVLRAGPRHLAAMIVGPKSLTQKLFPSLSPDDQAPIPQPFAARSSDGQATESATEKEPEQTKADASTPTAPTPELPDMVIAAPANLGRRAVLTAGVTIGVSALGWRWLQNQPRDQRLPETLRSGHELVEQAWRPIDAQVQSVRTFDPSKAGEIRVNGRHGIREPIDLASWQLQIIDGTGNQIDSVTMDIIQSLPETSMTTEHICIEGWSQIVTWTGVRFSDFADLYREEIGDDYQFVNMMTPDEGYYVSLDTETMQNDHTLLAYALNGETITQDHGAPLRLATPKKYGIKQIKRIGSIEFSNTKGPDYWTERGYDWYAHL